jgi:hypothetical protein
MNRTLLLIILIVLLLAALPTWPYSTAWGYYPSGGFGAGVDRLSDFRVDRQSLKLRPLRRGND